ncbi:MAG: phenylacetate--CoA ligase family protein, partial [Planctomycetes bacterium]|nr:phenylacetate--CoA ligase family protein [Planctomycetota bacterium]
ESGFHLYPDMEIVEIVDPDTGKQMGEGETGELVYTCLDGRGSTILRYRTGDIIVGGMTWEKCPGCGRTVQRMSSHLERVSNMKDFQLSKLKGTLVNLNLFKEELDNDERVEEWQLVIRKKDDDPYGVDEINLNLALASQCAGEDHGRISESIGNRLRQVTEVSLSDINIISLERILELLGMETQLKEKRIVDLRAAGKVGEEVVKG